VATAFLWAAYLLTASTFLTLTAALGNAATFWLFGLTAILAWVFVYHYMPETKARAWGRSKPTGRLGLQEAVANACVVVRWTAAASQSAPPPRPQNRLVG
jgi:hypothetical protein